MAGPKRELGDWGEEKAVTYLRWRGWHIVERNFSCRLGEIDIIASRFQVLAFIEVKLRRDDSHGEAREFVTRSKQERLIATAQFWLSQHDCELQPRFDVIEVYAPQGENGPLRINHLPDAFC
jgi:putative endonuclease